MNSALSPADVDAIALARRAFLSGMANDDVDAMVDLLTEDGQAYPPHEPALIGKEANRAWHEERIAQFRTDFSVSTDELLGDGDLGVERFSYVLTLTPREGGDPVEDRGRCIWIWRREGDSWKVARAMWNGPTPMAGED